MIIKFFTESTQLRHVSKKKKRLHSCNEEITDFVRADDNSSRSNISSIIAQNEMKSEKAQAAFNLFREYDYRIECEGKQPGCVDPIRLYFQKKRMQRILAVSKRRKLSCHTSELLTTRYQHMHTAAESQYHVLPQYDDNTSAMLATYDKPQHISTSTLLEDDMPYIEYSMVKLLDSHNFKQQFNLLL